MREELRREVEDRIREIFDENFEYIRAEGGRAVTDFIREEAFLQILYYFRKNLELVDKVSRAEVKLTLPGLQTPGKGLPYAIEGVVDIIREDDKVWMYDLKTHDLFQIENNRVLYRAQRTSTPTSGYA